MKILLTNDDGIYAEGLWALHRKFTKQHSVTIVAPDRERSAVGHAITLHEPLRTAGISFNKGCIGHAVNGTPADCIKLGMLEILDSRPDIVISGINPGANVGINVNYSGTVAAAKEASIYGVPSIAVSIGSHETDNYNDAALFVEILAKDILEKGLPFGTFLNVNIPDLPLKKIEGVRICKHGTWLHSEYLDKRVSYSNSVVKPIANPCRGDPCGRPKITVSTQMTMISKTG
ncbi:MAG: 5'/3'-nucleotidase SurE, partial [Deltaproteobacteria bacterium]|nr:5'/3'-nucleotidase SurE [Deltaproteobacteria bacterium]